MPERVLVLRFRFGQVALVVIKQTQVVPYLGGLIAQLQQVQVIALRNLELLLLERYRGQHAS